MPCAGVTGHFSGQRPACQDPCDGHGSVSKSDEIEKTRNVGKVLFADKNNTQGRVMLGLDQEGASFKSFLAEVRQGIKEWVERRIEAQLEAEVAAWLHRHPYARRAGVGHHQRRSQCWRGGTRQVGRCSRNGHRPRQIVTPFGVLTIWLPRVVCEWGERSAAVLHSPAIPTLLQQARAVFDASSADQAGQHRAAFGAQRRATASGRRHLMPR